MAEWTVRANYDAEARSWYVYDSDVPGLATGGDTLEEIAAKLPGMISDLLELNEHLFLDKERLKGDHSFRLVAHHETFGAIAA